MSEKINMELDKKKTISLILVAFTILLLANLYVLYDTNKKANQFSEQSEYYDADINNLESNVRGNAGDIQDHEERIEELEETIIELNETINSERTD